jgi:hypothetical protein
MPGKIFIDTNIVIYALGQASTKAHLAAPLFVDFSFPRAAWECRLNRAAVRDAE